MPSIIGTANRNIIVVPWVVKIWLYLSGLRKLLFGRASCVRISKRFNATQPAA